MRALAVRFRSMSRWDVKYYGDIGVDWRPDCRERLGDVLVRHVEPLSRDLLDRYRLASLHFDGTFTPREAAPTTLKGKLFGARAASVVYSKIDARNGAIGVVPTDFGPVAFTGEFPIYEINAERAQAQYMHLLLRTSWFLNLLNSLSVGHSGRKRVAPEVFEELLVPIPPLEDQLDIISCEFRLREQALSIFLEANTRERAIGETLLTKLGIARPQTTAKAKILVARSSELALWDLPSVMRGNVGLESTREDVRVVPLAECAERTFSGGTPPRSVKDYWTGNLPWASPKDFRSCVLHDTEEHLSETGLAQISGGLAPEGAVLIVVRSMILMRTLPVALAGLPMAINQDVKAVIPKEHVSPGYLAEYLRATQSFMLDQVKADSRRALRNETLDAFPVLIPSREEQEEIFAAIEGERRVIADLRRASSDLLGEAKKTVEELIRERCGTQ
jgi:type I restriction enzyme, S subunit